MLDLAKHLPIPDYVWDLPIGEQRLWHKVHGKSVDRQLAINLYNHVKEKWLPDHRTLAAAIRHAKHLATISRAALDLHKLIRRHRQLQAYGSTEHFPKLESAGLLLKGFDAGTQSVRQSKQFASTRVVSTYPRYGGGFRYASRKTTYGSRAYRPRSKKGKGYTWFYA